MLPTTRRFKPQAAFKHHQHAEVEAERNAERRDLRGHDDQECLGQQQQTQQQRPHQRPGEERDGQQGAIQLQYGQHHHSSDAQRQRVQHGTLLRDQQQQQQLDNRQQQAVDRPYSLSQARDTLSTVSASGDRPRDFGVTASQGSGGQGSARGSSSVNDRGEVWEGQGSVLGAGWGMPAGAGGGRAGSQSSADRGGGLGFRAVAAAVRREVEEEEARGMSAELRELRKLRHEVEQALRQPGALRAAEAQWEHAAGVELESGTRAANSPLGYGLGYGGEDGQWDAAQREDDGLASAGWGQGVGRSQGQGQPQGQEQGHEQGQPQGQGQGQEQGQRQGQGQDRDRVQLELSFGGDALLAGAVSEAFTHAAATAATAAFGPAAASNAAGAGAAGSRAFSMGPGGMREGDVTLSPCPGTAGPSPAGSPTPWSTPFTPGQSTLSTPLSLPTSTLPSVSVTQPLVRHGGATAVPSSAPPTATPAGGRPDDTPWSTPFTPGTGFTPLSPGSPLSSLTMTSTQAPSPTQNPNPSARLNPYPAPTSASGVSSLSSPAWSPTQPYGAATGPTQPYGAAAGTGAVAGGGSMGMGMGTQVHVVLQPAPQYSAQTAYVGSEGVAGRQAGTAATAAAAAAGAAAGAATGPAGSERLAAQGGVAVASRPAPLPPLPPPSLPPHLQQQQASLYRQMLQGEAGERYSASGRDGSVAGTGTYASSMVSLTASVDSSTASSVITGKDFA